MGSFQFIGTSGFKKAFQKLRLIQIHDDEEEALLSPRPEGGGWRDNKGTGKQIME